MQTIYQWRQHNVYRTLKRQNNFRSVFATDTMCFRHIIGNTLYIVFTIYTKVTNNIITIITQYKICRNKKEFRGFCSESQDITLKGKGSMSQHVVTLLSRHTFQDILHISPRFSCADVRSSTPVINVPVKFVGEVIVQHSAQAVTHSLVLLKMGKIIARNMLS